MFYYNNVVAKSKMGYNIIKEVLSMDNYFGREPRQRNNIFEKLVERANKTANSEEAQKIRKMLLKWGVVGIVVGGIGLIICMILFITVPFSSFGNFNTNISGIALRMGLVFIGFVICSVILSVSVLAVKAGLAITVAGITAETMDTNRYCPKCHDRIDEHEKFCNKCGYDLRFSKKCGKCGYQNDFEDEYCTQCGNKIG
jgi:hypothetical protein